MNASISQIQSARGWLWFDNVRTWLLVILTVILVGAVYMGQTRQAAITGQRVHDKQDQLERVMQENAQLEADIAVLMAPSRIEARARAMGLHLASPDQIKYLTIKNYPSEPSKPGLATRTSPATTASLSDLVSWWNDLLARVGLQNPHTAEATSP
jgi:cell division protein FtsB